MKKQNLPPKIQSQVLTQQQSFQMFRSGPLPAPSDLEKYESILPGAADRIFQMAEKQQLHRMGIEKDTISRQQKRATSCQYLGFVIGMTGLVGAIYSILQGHEIGGSIFGGTALISLVALFVLGKHKIDKNITEKN